MILSVHYFILSSIFRHGNCLKQNSQTSSCIQFSLIVRSKENNYFSKRCSDQNNSTNSLLSSLLFVADTRVFVRSDGPSDVDENKINHFLYYSSQVQIHSCLRSFFNFIFFAGIHNCELPFNVNCLHL